MDKNPQHITSILADCLDAVHSGRLSAEDCAARYPDHTLELSELLQTARTVKGGAVAKPSPAFRQTARARLIEKLPDQLPVTNRGFLRHIGQILSLRQMKQRRFAMNILAILAILAATALGGGGVVYASGDALPGDALYGVKTGAEDVQLALAGDAQDINLYNQFLAERTAEMGALVEAERFDDLDGAAERYQQNLAAMVHTMLENPKLGEMVMQQVQEAQQQRVQTMTRIMENAPEKDQGRFRQMLAAEAEQLPLGPGEPGQSPGEPGMGSDEAGQGENEPGQGPGQPGGVEDPAGTGQDGASGQGQNQDESGQGQAQDETGQGQGQDESGQGQGQDETGQGQGQDESGQGQAQDESGQGQGQGESGQGQGQDETGQGQDGQSEPGEGEPQGNGEPGMGVNEPVGTAVPSQGEPGQGSGTGSSGSANSGSGDSGSGQGGSGSGKN